MARQPAEEQPCGVTAQREGQWPPQTQPQALLGLNGPTIFRGALVKGRGRAGECVVVIVIKGNFHLQGSLPSTLLQTLDDVGHSEGYWGHGGHSDRDHHGNVSQWGKLPQCHLEKILMLS